jgi:hypothetical protein
MNLQTLELERGELDANSIFIWANDGSDGGQHIATVSAEEVGCEQAEAFANLFAAAGYLLAACERSAAYARLNRVTEPRDDTSKSIAEDCEAAIAKAKGGA